MTFFDSDLFFYTVVVFVGIVLALLIAEVTNTTNSVIYWIAAQIV